MEGEDRVEDKRGRWREMKGKRGGEIEEVGR